MSVALGVGVAGALVDVTSSAKLESGLSFRAGREDQFNDVDASTFSFVLDNADGTFTPDNAGSSLATTLSEGAAACVLVGSRLTAGTVRSVEPVFPGGDAAWAEVRVSCDDMLGDAARAGLAGDLYSQASLVSGQAFWPLDDAAGSASGRELVAGVRPFRGGSLSFGVDGVSGVGGTQAEVSVAAGASAELTVYDPTSRFDIGLSDLWWNFWLTPMTAGGYFRVVGSATPDGFVVQGLSVVGDGNVVASLEVGRSVFVSLYGSGFVQVWLDGVQVHLGTTAGTPNFGPALFTVGDAAYGASQFRISQLSASADRIDGSAALESTIEGRLNLIDTALSTITFDTIPAELTQAPIGPNQSTDTALDAINELMTAEQGYVYTATTGTLTSPVEKIVVGERARPETVAYTFDIIDELDGAPSFIRDLTNLISTVRVRGADTDVYVSDATLTARAGAASSSATVPYIEPVDLTAWGEDRIYRGANSLMRIASVTVDAMTTPTDRSADLLTMVFGDRVQFTSLPSTTLGFDTWDGWLIGREETHTVDGHRFVLHFAPVLPDTAVFDTDRFMAEGEIDLAANINAAVTSIVVDTTGAQLSTTDVPYTVLIGAEQLTVTAATAGASQTLTVTRGANGSTAAAHVSGDLVQLTPDSLYAF